MNSHPSALITSKRRSFGVSAAASWLLVLGSFSVEVHSAPPDGFHRETVLSGLHQPTALEFLSEHAVLVLEKGGHVLLVDTSTVPAQASTYLELGDVDSSGERGLVAAARDPQFDQNGWLYLYYFKDSDGRFRISRFQHLGSRADPSSELVLWRNPQTASSCCHYGGGLSFGPDEKLYLTTGEEFIANDATNLEKAGGKILRFERDGSIPPDNPFVDGAGGNLDEIWAYGLRNPYRASWDLATERLFIGEVGGNDQATATEDIHLGRAGADYGWPACEGDCALPGRDDPVYSYRHDGSGASVTGGVVYRGAQFPSSYDGVYFYGDFVREWIRYLAFDDDGDTVTGSFDFDPAAGNVVGIGESPDGSLYWVTHSGELLRAQFDDGDAPPTILRVEADVSSGSAPLRVRFSAEAEDPEGSAVTYRWILGDGTEAVGPSVSHVYDRNGEFEVRLSVSDGTRGAVSEPLRIQVGSVPAVQLIRPEPGQTFRAGDTIEFAAAATDADGTLTDDDFVWTIRFIHNEHEHPAYGPIPGRSGSFSIPFDGHDFHDETGYAIRLEVIDEDGLRATREVNVYPEKVVLSFDTVPTGLPISLDGIRRDTPFDHDTLVGFRHVVSALDTRCFESSQFVLREWSDGLSSTHTITVPDVDSTLIASYDDEGDCVLPVTPGLVLQLDSTTDVLVSGGSVTAWRDRSSAGNHLTAGGDPVLVPDGLSGHPVVRLRGGSDRLERAIASDLPLGDDDRTLFAVVRYRGFGPGGVTYGTSSCNRSFGIAVDVDGSLLIQGSCESGDFRVTSQGTGSGWMVQSVVLKAGVFRHARNGRVLQTRTVAGRYDTAAGRIVVGAAIDGSGGVAMDLVEVLAYDRALSDAEMRIVEAYFESKYFGSSCPPGVDCNLNDVPDRCELSHPGNALESDGIDDWVNVPDFVLGDDFTVEAWVRLASAPTSSDSVLGTETQGADLSFAGGRLRLRSAEAAGDVLVATTPAAAGTWTHYAVTREAGDLTLFVDGEIDATGAWNGPFRIEALGRGRDGVLHGGLDELRVWSVARSVDEIRAARTRTVWSHSRGLEAYWTFDESLLDQSVRDRSGSARHGTLGRSEGPDNDDPHRVDVGAPVTSTVDDDADGRVDDCLDLPRAPGGLAATVDDRSVALSWNAPVDDRIEGFVVYRSDGGAEPRQINDALLRVAEFVDDSVVGGVEYEYGVAAVNAAGESAVSETVQVPAFGIPMFRRADANADAQIDITDAIFTLGFLFGGSRSPVCFDASDANDDGATDLSDAIYTLLHLFSGDFPIPPPHGDECGVDPTPDPLPDCGYPEDGCPSAPRP